MYQLKITPPATQPNNILCLSTNICIPINEANTDYQEYLKWVEAGNTPLPADE